MAYRRKSRRFGRRRQTTGRFRRRIMRRGRNKYSSSTRRMRNPGRIGYRL